MDKLQPAIYLLLNEPDLAVSSTSNGLCSTRLGLPPTFRERDVAKFHVQLALSMLLMLIVFVAGIGRTENRAGCITVGVLLHYLILVTWMWMGAEAVLLFQKLIIVFKEITTLEVLFISVMCWG